jgi:dTDP-4-dehydrorhamnose reductase
MLGDAVYAAFRDASTVRATDLDCTEPWISSLDVRDLDALRREADVLRPTCIFHLAALTNMEYCETHPEEAYLTNASGTENVAVICGERNLPLVYISTAGVFDGEQDTYVEHDRPSPLSVYGRSKYIGEVAVRQLPHHFIFRAGWMMGGGPRKDKKFVNKLIKQLRAGAREIHVVDDKLGSPTYSVDFTRTMTAIIETGRSGLYHVVGQGRCSRVEMARQILRHFRLERKVKLTLVSSDYWSREYFAPRPRSEQLLNRELNVQGIAGMQHWKKSLAQYLESHDWEIG